MFGSSVCWKRPFSGSAHWLWKINYISLYYYLLPALLIEKNRRSTSLLQVPPPVIVVISPLNSLIHDKIRRINTVRNRAAVLSFTRPMEADQAVEHGVLDQTNVDELRLPESIVYMTLGLQRVHISAKQIFHAPLHPSNKTFLSPRFWETRDQRLPGSFPTRRRGRAWVRGCTTTRKQERIPIQMCSADYVEKLWRVYLPS